MLDHLPVTVLSSFLGAGKMMILDCSLNDTAADTWIPSNAQKS